MAEAADRFLEALSTEQRAVAQFPFTGDERYVWNYTPVLRNGLRLKDMTVGQRGAALALLASGLSARGAQQAQQIIALEPILKEAEELEGVTNTWRRDPELYYFSIFGEPGGAAPWAWRAGGHHLGIHFTVVGGELVAPTPLFFGSNPAEVRHGPSTGLRVLAAEEDMAAGAARQPGAGAARCRHRSILWRPATSSPRTIANLNSICRQTAFVTPRSPVSSASTWRVWFATTSSAPPTTSPATPGSESPTPAWKP